MKNTHMEILGESLCGYAYGLSRDIYNEFINDYDCSVITDMFVSSKNDGSKKYSMVLPPLCVPDIYVVERGPVPPEERVAINMKQKMIETYEQQVKYGLEFICMENHDGQQKLSVEMIIKNEEEMILGAL